MHQTERVTEQKGRPDLSHADIERLIWLRTRIERGECSEYPIEYKRLRFAKYLYQRRLIHD